MIPQFWYKSPKYFPIKSSLQYERPDQIILPIFEFVLDIQTYIIIMQIIVSSEEKVMF